jgi:hypothetical protein
VVYLLLALLVACSANGSQRRIGIAQTQDVVNRVRGWRPLAQHAPRLSDLLSRGRRDNVLDNVERLTVLKEAQSGFSPAQELTWTVGLS